MYEVLEDVEEIVVELFDDIENFFVVLLEDGEDVMEWNLFELVEFNGDIIIGDVVVLGNEVFDF